MDGLLVEVAENQLGSNATVAAAIDATEIVVADITDYPEDGGVIDILGMRYEYVSVAADPPTMDATGELLGGGSLFLSEPVTVPVDEDDPVWLVVGDQVATEAVAIVDIDTGDDTETPDGGDMMHISLDVTQRLAFPVAVYDPPLPVTLSDDLRQIISAPGVRPVVDGGLIDPETIPEPVPVDPPEVSPSIAVEGLPNSLLIKTFDAVSPTTILHYHVSTTPEFTPDATTLAAETRATVFILKELPDGTPLTRDVVYHVRVVATNAAGSADPSPAVTGTLDPDAVIEWAVERIVAGFVLAGTIQVGQITIDADNGITIPSGSGVVRFPVDGSTATITAKLVATALTMQGTATVQNVMDVLGSVTLADAGVASPSVAPTLGSTWADLPLDWQAARAALGYTPEQIPDPGALFTDVGIAYDAGTNRFAINGGWSGFHIFDAANGAYVSTVPGSSSGSGLVRLGSNYYTASSVVLSRTEVGMAVHKYDLSGNYITSFIQPERYATGGGPSAIVVGTDTGNLLLGWSSSATQVTVRTLSTSGVSSGSAAYTMPTGWTPGGPGLAAIWRGSLLYGAARTVIIPKSGNAGVYNGTVEQTANRFNAGVWIRGTTWESGHFTSVLISGQQLLIRRHAPTAAARTVSASYTWYDDNPAGSGPAGAAFHETRPSPAASASIPAGKYVTVEGSPAPAAGATSPGPDDARIVRIYAGTPTRTRQATLPVGVRVATLGALSAGAAEPTENTFLGVPGFTPGMMQSEATDADGPKIILRGNGSGRIGSYKWGTDGRAPIPAISTYRTSPLTIASGDTTLVGMNVVRGDASGGMTLSAGTVIVPRTGWYSASGSVTFAASTSSARRLILVGVGPSAGVISTFIHADSLASAQDTSNISVLHVSVSGVYLTAGACIGLSALVSTNWGLDVSQPYMCSLSVTWAGD